jgi:RNA-directed DNA polymerase
MAKGSSVCPPENSQPVKDKQRHGTLRKFAWTKIMRHRLVPTTFSPDDPTLQDYWQKRWAKPQVTALRRRQLVQRQQGICPVCHQHLENGEELHMHHMIPKKSGSKDSLANLWLVHHTCHRQIHSSSAPLGVRRLLEPCTR